MTGFRYNVSGGVSYYTVDEFEMTGKARTCFSTRVGGVSTSGYGSLNLGYKSGDTRINVGRNIKLLCDAAGFNIEDLVLSDQVHGNRYRIVGFQDRGMGGVRESDIEGVDALITGDRNTAICIFTADCVPVLLMDKNGTAAGVCHAGWRGVVNGIVSGTVGAMMSTYGVKTGNMIAAIGPSIGPCCFNVGSDVVREFGEMFHDADGIIVQDKGQYRINLWNAVIRQLEASGIDSRSIINSELCTSCRKENFYSYRRDGSGTGRMISIVQLL